MSFTKLEECLADIKIWKKDVAGSAVATPSEVRDQFLHNVAPMLEAIVKASMHELGETYEALDDMDAAIGELVGREGDFLQPEMASDLTATFILGLFIIDLIYENKIQLDDELQNKKLRDATQLYRQQATILLDQIKAITVEDDGEEEDSDDDTDDDDGDGETDDLHGESGEVVAIGGGTGGRGVPGGSPVGRGVRGGAGGAGAEADADSSEEEGA